MKTKNVFLTLAALICAALACSSCGDRPGEITPKVINVTGVTLNKPAMSLVERGTEALIATVAPDDATNRTVSWSSSDPAVATISGGIVTAVKAGTAAIIVSTADGGKTATAGTALTLTGTVAPPNATNRTIAWSVVTAGTTGATISGSTFNATAAGTGIVHGHSANALFNIGITQLTVVWLGACRLQSAAV